MQPVGDNGVFLRYWSWRRTSMPCMPSRVTSSLGVSPKRSAWRMPVSNASCHKRVHMCFSSSVALASALLGVVTWLMAFMACAGWPCSRMRVSWIS